MVDAPLRTIVVARSAAQAADLANVLISAGITIGARRVEDAGGLVSALADREHDWDLVLCATGGGFDAATVVELVRRDDREVPVVLLGPSGTGGDPASGVVALTPDLSGPEIAGGVRRELTLAETRRAARLAIDAPELRDRAMASASKGIVISDARIQGFPVVYANPAFERLTQWSAAQVLGQSCALLQGPASEPGAIREMRSALRSARPCQVTLVNYRRDGSTFHGEVSLSLVRDADSEVSHVVGVLEDVTARLDADGRPKAPQTDNETLLNSLAEAETRYRRFVDHIPAVTYVAEFDEIGTLRYISPQIEDLTGHPPEQFLTNHNLLMDLIHPDDRERVREETLRVFRDREEFDCEFRMIDARGRELWVWERDTVIRDEAGHPLFTQGVLLDITQLRGAEIALRDVRDGAHSTLDMAGTIIVVLDPDGRIALLNRTGHALLGYEDGELVGEDWFEACVPEVVRADVAALFLRCMRGDAEIPATFESAVVTRGGEERTVVWHSTLLRDGDGKVTAAMSSGTDITDRRGAEEQIAYLAYHDSLTGLPNRALLSEHLELALGRARRNERSVALLYLDLDDFKLVNDSLGHAVGDVLLRMVAERLGRRRRESDLLARQVGDEFLLLISDIERDAVRVAEAAAEGMLSVLSDPFEVEGSEVYLGGSVGISVFPRDAADADTLLRHADRAMYEAKADGRSGVHLHAGDAGEPLERQSLASRVRKAVAEDELVLHWQPIVDPADGTVHALEALVRWQDPIRGLVGPADFIGVAEETGLIDRVGEWVAEAVCVQRRAWLEEGLEPTVALNVSPHELRRAEYAGELLGRLERHGLDPAGLVVEVTDSAAMLGQGRSEVALHELAAGGLRLAVDDFGTGYSSLGRLRELPVRVLKLDRSFLRGVPERDDATAIVVATLDLAAALGLDVVPVGVETEAQRRFVVQHGCRFAQGFLLGRPVPAAELGNVLRRPAPAPA